MFKRDLTFIGVLFNTDATILKINLDHGFKIEEIPIKELIDTISQLENTPPKFILETTRGPIHSLFTYRKYIIIRGHFEAESRDLGNPDDVKLSTAATEFDREVVRGYLEPTVRLMRLFKEGNICMPKRYYFFIHNQSPKLIYRFIDSGYIQLGNYYLSQAEIAELQEFIKEIKLPFKEPALQLAFENYEQSYFPNLDIDLSFLTLMMSLESLFNPSGEGELTFRISRNTAVLIGKDKNDSESIWKNVREFYRRRSELVHKGKAIIDECERLTLRDYVRRSIKAFYKIGKKKNNILEVLNSSAFGDGPSIQENARSKER